jgi:hypothetical protein
MFKFESMEKYLVSMVHIQTLTFGYWHKLLSRKTATVTLSMSYVCRVIGFKVKICHGQNS